MARAKNVAGTSAKSEEAKSETDATKDKASEENAEQSQGQSDQGEDEESSDTTPNETSKKAKKVKNLARAGKTVFAVTGSPVVFDGKGIAMGSEEDLAYLLTVPGYEGV
jgi:hypothetical protein